MIRAHVSLESTVGLCSATAYCFMLQAGAWERGRAMRGVAVGNRDVRRHGTMHGVVDNTEAQSHLKSQDIMYIFNIYIY
jgi:hypothetical protein